MGNAQDAEARTEGTYHAGTHPTPGGKTDTETAPPYDGRTKGANESESARAAGESVERQLADTPGSQPERAESPGGSNVDPATGKDGTAISKDEVSHRTPNDPYGVGTSASQKGETFAEPATEHQGPTNRPVGQVESDLMEPNNSGSGTSDPNN